MLRHLASETARFLEWASSLLNEGVPIQAEMKRLLDDPAAVDAALRQGAGKAAGIADPIVRRAEELVGFLPAR